MSVRICFCYVHDDHILCEVTEMQQQQTDVKGSLNKYRRRHLQTVLGDIMGRDSSVPKFNQLHLDILWVFFIKLRYIP